MKNKLLRKALVLVSVGLLAVSCNKKLNVNPIIGNDPAKIYDSMSTISDVMAKVYGGMTLSGSSAGSCDLGNYDPGTSVLYRMYWCAEELPTDEAKIAWNDGNLPDYNTDTWNANNDKLHLLYDRTFYQIAVCNEFIRNLPASKINSFSAANAATLKNYVAEARFIRALCYWIAMDCYGNIPFATEANNVGTTPPKRATRAQVFNYLTSELTSMQANLLAPGAVYGRADQGCANFLLAKLYLNAQVYTGTAHWDSAVYFSNLVVNNEGYSLAPNYANLFKIDNQTTSKSEIIFPLLCNGNLSQSYGNSTFLVNAGVGGSAVASTFGISGGWAGYRATSNMVALFPNPYSTVADNRALLDSTGQTLAMPAVLNYPNGYRFTKFRNVSSTGTPGSQLEFCDLDIPLFRLADAYLMYAEASLRNGDAATAMTYVNKVRARANAPAMTNVTVDSILAERGRELYLEGSRRTDLIRFGYFGGSNSGNYLWPWKGGSEYGMALSSNLNLFPLPTTDLNNNPNLTQNPGY